MRYDVKKFLFVGVEEERNAFFKRAQEAGIIHFIPSKQYQSKVVSNEVMKLAKAIKILRGQPVVLQEETEEFEIADGLAQKIITWHEQYESLMEEERTLRLEMARVDVFGNFSLDDVRYIEKEGKRKIQYFCAKQGLADSVNFPNELIYIDSDNGLDYFVAINKEPKQYPKMIEMIIDRPYGVLKQRYLEVEKEIHECESRLKGYAKYNNFLHHAYVNKLNVFSLEEAKSTVDFPLTQPNLFVVQGWVPKHKLDELYKLVSEMKIYIEEIAIDSKDVVPTYLENSGAARIGEDLVNIYDTPSITDRDPSLWVLFFFALFFAMVIGDGGYGIVLLIIALYIRYKHTGMKGAKKRVLDLTMILAFACIVWGVLTTSFFGITVAPDSPIRRVSLISWLVEKKAEYSLSHQDEAYHEWVKKFPKLEGVKDPQQFLNGATHEKPNGKIVYDAYNKFADDILLELALLIGVIHITISMIRNIDRNWANAGWIIFLFGAYLYLPVFLGATSISNFVFGINPKSAEINGLYMIYGGLALAVILAMFKHKLLGLLEVSHVIQIFADVLSYLRLYALALAGALLIATVIDLADSVPFVFGIIILIIGHLINIILGVMLGIIHGLRLNFLEWYRYCFEGGGKLFNPLRKRKIE